MSKKITETYFCDICHKEKPKEELENMRIPMYRTFDATEGRYTPKYYVNELVDICLDCLDKVAIVRSVGVMCQKYELPKNENNE